MTVIKKELERCFDFKQVKIMKFERFKKLHEGNKVHKDLFLSLRITIEEAYKIMTGEDVKKKEVIQNVKK